MTSVLNWITMIYSYNYQKLRKISLEEAITQNLEVCLFVFLNKQ